MRVHVSSSGCLMVLCSLVTGHLLCDCNKLAASGNELLCDDPAETRDQLHFVTLLPIPHSPTLLFFGRQGSLTV